MKKVLIASCSNLKNDPRVWRQITSLKDNYDITTVGIASSALNEVKFYPIKGIQYSTFSRMIRAAKYKLKMYEDIYWKTYDFGDLVDCLAGEKFDLIIANDIHLLPFAVKIARQSGSKILWDAHEYSPRQYEYLLKWRFFFQDYVCYVCRHYIPQVDRIITVTDRIAREYFNNYGKPADVITNACDYNDILPSRVDSKKIKLIHHGGASPGRKIESMIKMMDYLDDRFHFDLMLLPMKNKMKYYNKLKTISANNPRIRILPPVPMQQLVKITSEWDIGVYLLHPNGFNNRNALPNKFFEFIHARLAVAVGPSPEMAKLVKKYDIGIVSDDFSPQSMAKELNTLTKEKIDYYKQQSHKAAKEMCSQLNMKKLKEIVRELI